MTALLSLALLAPLLVSAQNPNAPGVRSTGANGQTNPSAPSLGTAINQSSLSRLATVNSVDDFCIWGPPESGGGPENVIGSVEPVVVAYCTKPRNNARVIPDGTIYAAHFVKTPMYVQVQGFFDGTKIGIPYGDDGGELDPHGPEGLGNPIGGNVTSNVSGSEVFYEEWMSFMSYNQFCIRVCTAATDDISAALMCEHELDIMGCQFVMPGDYTNNTFTSCEGDAAAPPGDYPQPDGSTSTFRQRFTGTYTNPTQTVTYTVGNLATPSAPFSIPATSQCTTYSTIGNGIASLAVSGAAATGAASSAVSSASRAVSSGVASASSVVNSARSSISARASGALASASAAASSAGVSSAGRSLDLSLPGMAMALVAVGLGAAATLL